MQLTQARHQVGKGPLPSVQGRTVELLRRLFGQLIGIDRLFQKGSACLIQVFAASAQMVRCICRQELSLCVAIGAGCKRAGQHAHLVLLVPLDQLKSQQFIEHGTRMDILANACNQ